MKIYFQIRYLNKFVIEKTIEIINFKE